MTDGTLVTYASMDLETTEVVRLDLSESYPRNLDQGATYAYEATGAFDGSPAAKFTPPVDGDGHSGIGGLSLDKGGTFEINKLNFAFEMLFGSTYTSNYGLNDIKWIIVLTAESLGGETSERPMANWAHKDDQSDAVMAFAVGAGTVKQFNPSAPPDQFGPDGGEEFYIGASGGTYGGKPRIAPDTWLHCEFECISANAYGATNGRIRGVITDRSGDVLTDISIPWNYDDSWTLPNFIREIRIIGGYYNQAFDSVDENTYFKLAGLRIAVNRSGLIGTRTGFTDGEEEPDTTPSAFHFTDQTDVERSSTITSAAITVGGIDAAATITVSGGTYDINGSGDFTSDPGTVEAGDTVRARHTSSASYSTATNTVVTIGGVSDTFTSITEADPSSDTTPDAFSFTDQSDVARSTVITSAAITVAGIDAPATISVSGGTYDINGSGTFVSSPGTVEVGDTVRARHTSSASYGTATNTVITIGGVSDTFTSTTEENDTPVPAYRWFRVRRQ